jgi:tetratricopeptide (TPR) repeat protein
VPIDRESTIRQAEKLQLQGRLDAAIAEYVRLTEDQPRDWNAINALGDLYVRAGDIDRAVAQFLKIADHLFGEGFFPKAAALYKKALKTKPDHEHTLLRLAEIASAQELLADARGYLRRLWELRSERGDDKGAADCLIRLALLPEADAETQLTGARAAKALGDSAQAVSLFRGAAEKLNQAGRDAAAQDALAQVVALDPSDADLRRRLARQYVAAGQLESAGQLLDEQTAGTDPDLLLSLAQIQLARNDDAAAHTTVTKFMTGTPERSGDVLRLAGQLGRAGEADRAFACAEIVVDDAVLRGEWTRALHVLQSFLTHGAYIPALLKLVQVAGDAGVDDALQEAHERLAEAYIDSGQGAEAREIAEALLSRAPGSSVHADRLRRALIAAGVEEPDEELRQLRHRLEPQSAPPAASIGDTAVAAEPDRTAAFERYSMPALTSDITLELTSDAIITLDGDVAEDLTVATDITEMEKPVPSATAEPEGPDSAGPVEIDLSEAVASLGSSIVAAPTPARAGSPAPGPAPELETVFEALRPRTADFTGVAQAAVMYERALQRLAVGQVREALPDLEGAARVPVFRFPAAARLGREYMAMGHVEVGIRWLERATEVPPPSQDDGLAVLYELGVALAQVGERARALAVLMEIESEDAGYRDVRKRIDALTATPGRSGA